MTQKMKTRPKKKTTQKIKMAPQMKMTQNEDPKNDDEDFLLPKLPFKLCTFLAFKCLILGDYPVTI